MNLLLLIAIFGTIITIAKAIFQPLLLVLYCKEVFLTLFFQTNKLVLHRLCILQVNGVTGQDFTYRDYDKIGRGFAKGLEYKYGLSKGDSIALFLQNSPEYAMAMVGLTTRGIVSIAARTWPIMEHNISTKYFCVCRLYQRSTQLTLPKNSVDSSLFQKPSLCLQTSSIWKLLPKPYRHSMV